MIFTISTKLPGQPWVRISGMPRPPQGAFMDEVDIVAVDICRELSEAIEAGFLRSPVEALAPIVGDALQIGHLRTGVPARVLELIRPARAGEPLPEIGDGWLWD